MGKHETPIQQRILLALGALPGVRVSRNNNGALRAPGGRLVRFGVFNPGGGDILGLMAPNGRFLAVETKRPGKEPDQQQEKFRDMVIELGGLYVVAHSVEEAVNAVMAAMEEQG